MSRRRVWLLVTVPAVVVVVSLVIGWAIVYLTKDPAANGVAYAHRIDAGSDFVNVTADARGNDSCNCVQLWFVGPSDADPVLIFTGPNLNWVRTTGDEPANYPAGITNVANAESTTAVTGHCGVGLMTETPEYLTDLYTVAMTAAQLQGWHQGRLQLVELDIDCDRDVGSNIP